MLSNGGEWLSGGVNGYCSSGESKPGRSDRKMSELAMRGGRAVYSGTWPKWPVCDQREVERMVKVVRSGQWSWNGLQETEFRQGFAKFLGAKHGLCVTNGTHALQLALEALDVGA